MKTIMLKLFMPILMLAFVFNANGQIDIRSKVQREVNNRVEKKVDEGIRKAADEVEKELEEGETPEDNEKEDGDDREESPRGEAERSPSANQEPSMAVYSKFDFIPGEKVIFYEDFSQDKVGDFPVLWNTNGVAEVVTTSKYPGQWLQVTDESSVVWNDKPLVLPENYTIEFDVLLVQSDILGLTSEFAMTCSDDFLNFEGGPLPGKAGFVVTLSDWNAFYRAYHSNESFIISGQNSLGELQKDRKYHMSIWVQKQRVRVYLDEAKLFDLPKALDLNCRFNKIRFQGGIPLISNIRIAGGLPDMRSKLLTEGKLVSYGIYFDVNKDQVKPESYGTLKEIAKIMTENPDLKVKIVGHTDSDGADASNLDLSKRRGASVKNELVKTFGISEGRLQSDGLGESQPIAPNDTQANKALNRRVEFIKL